MNLRAISQWTPDSAEFQAVTALDTQFINYPWKEADWLLALSSKTLFVWEDSIVRGFALYQLSPVEELAHLLKIVVHPSARENGGSREFWNQQVAALKERGLKRIYLEVAVDNLQAQRFYIKNGAKTLQRVKGFYQDGTDALTMEVHF